MALLKLRSLSTILLRTFALLLLIASWFCRMELAVVCWLSRRAWLNWFSLLFRFVNIVTVLSFIVCWLSRRDWLNSCSLVVNLLRRVVLLLLIVWVVVVINELKLESNAISLSIIATWLSLIFVIRLVNSVCVFCPWDVVTSVRVETNELISFSFEAILFVEDVLKAFVIEVDREEILLLIAETVLVLELFIAVTAFKLELLIAVSVLLVKSEILVFIAFTVLLLELLMAVSVLSAKLEILVFIAFTVLLLELLIAFSVFVAKLFILVLIALIVLKLPVLIAPSTAPLNWSKRSFNIILVPSRIVSSSSWLVRERALLVFIVLTNEVSWLLTVVILPVICVSCVAVNPPPPPPLVPVILIEPPESKMLELPDIN